MKFKRKLKKNTIYIYLEYGFNWWSQFRKKNGDEFVVPQNWYQLSWSFCQIKKIWTPPYSSMFLIYWWINEKYFPLLNLTRNVCSSIFIFFFQFNSLNEILFNIYMFISFIFMVTNWSLHFYQWIYLKNEIFIIFIHISLNSSPSRDCKQ